MATTCGSLPTAQVEAVKEKESMSDTVGHPRGGPSNWRPRLMVPCKGSRRLKSDCKGGSNGSTSEDKHSVDSVVVQCVLLTPQFRFLALVCRASVQPTSRCFASGKRGRGRQGPVGACQEHAFVTGVLFTI